MSVKLLTEHHLEFLSLKGGCTGSSESTLVKMPHCWKPHVAAHMCLLIRFATGSSHVAEFNTYNVCTVESSSLFISFLYLDLYVLGDDSWIS